MILINDGTFVLPIILLLYQMTKKMCNLNSIRANVRPTGNTATVFLDVKLTSTVTKRIKIKSHCRDIIINLRAHKTSKRQMYILYT